MDATELIESLKSQADKKLIEERKKKFGISTHNALGLTQKQLNETIKGVRKDKATALTLFDSNIYEAKVLCAKLFPPKELNEVVAEKFVQCFDNWEICDTFSMKLFAPSPLAIDLINKWADRQAEFEKRAAFATIAGLTLADKQSTNEQFLPFFELIQQAADDDRLYVKKGVSWALRSLGKRNKELQKEAIKTANKLLVHSAKSAQWIAKDTLKELSNPKVRIADYPRSIYRPK